MQSSGSAKIQVGVNSVGQNGDGAAASLAMALRESTRDAHARAESHPVQAFFIRGAVSRAQYAAWLQEMLHIWRTLDAALSSAAQRDPRITAVRQPYHAHADRVAADLRFLGFAEDGTPPLPATAALLSDIDHAATSQPAMLLGIWYVLEGSANGGRFIAKALARGLDLHGPEGLASFDPHGDAQRDRWQAWRAAVDAQTFSSAERSQIVAAANRTFDAVYALMNDMTGRDVWQPIQKAG